MFLFHFPDPCLVVGIVFEGRISVMDCLLTRKHFVPMPHFISIFLSDVAGQSLFLIHVTDSCFLISYLDQIEIT